MAGTAGGADGLSGRAIRSFCWAALSFGGSRLVLFGMTMALTRLLSPDQFGVVAAGLTVISFLEIGLDLGLGASLVYEQQHGLTDRVRTAYTVNLLFAAVLTGLAEVLAPLVARAFHAPEQVALFRVLFLYLLLRAVVQVQDAVLRRDLQFHRRILVDLTRAGCRAAVAIALAAAGHGAWSIVLGLLVGEAAAGLVISSLVRLRPSLRPDRATARQLLRFGVAVLALKVTDAVALDSDYIVVGAVLGPTALGYYTVGYRLPELLLFNIYWIFSTIAFPMYAQVRARGGQDLAVAMLRALQLITLFSFPAAVGLALVSRDAVVVLFSATWAPAVPPMALIALTTGLGSIGYASGDIFTAMGRPGTLLRLNVATTSVLVLSMVLVAPYGITAVASMHLLFNLGYAPVRLQIANRLVGSTWRQDLAAMRPGAYAALGVVVAAGPLRLVLPAGLGTLVLLVAAGAAGAAAALLVLAPREVRELLGQGRLLAASRAGSA